jgi:hypothetical protein
MPRSFSLLGLCLLCCAPAVPRQPPAPRGLVTQGPKAAGPRRPQLSKFEELTRGAQHRPGFFDTYQRDGQIYLAVPRARLGQEFLLLFTLVQGLGTEDFYPGQRPGWREPAVCAFERHGDRIYLVRRPARLVPPGPGPLRRAVLRAYGGSVLESARIEASRPDGALLIAVGDWLLSDLSGLSAAVHAELQRGKPGRIPIDRARSYLGPVRAFPDNLGLHARLTLAPPEPGRFAAVPDNRFLTVGLHYTLARLPDPPMAPRPADDRMGFLVSARKDFTSQEPGFFVRHTVRWRLPPGRTLTFYLDPAIPAPYRPFIEEGVRAWGRAFAQAGLPGALQVAPLPEGADPEDLRYPLIRWGTAFEDGGRRGVAAPVIDPRTGEILSATVVIEAATAQEEALRFRRLFGGGAAAEVASDGDGFIEPPDFFAALSGQAVLLRAALVVQGALQPGQPLPIEVVGQRLRHTTMHEIGHALGLRHNFRASADIPMERLADPAWLREHGVTSSVMDYPGLNLPEAAKGPPPPDFPFYSRDIGPADVLAISFGYAPDEERARAVAAQAAARGYSFASDEDAEGGGAVDPLVSRWDLGQDPLGWAQRRTALLSSILADLPGRVLAPGSRYVEVTEALDALLDQYEQAARVAIKYVGGQLTSRDHHGDPGGRPPALPVPLPQQRAALAFLGQAALGPQALRLPQRTLALLGQPRWSHWGERATFGGRPDYPIHRELLALRGRLLSALLDPLLLSRLRDGALRFGPEGALPIPDLLHTLTDQIWAELAELPRTREIPSPRRDLQRLYLDRLILLALEPPQGLPADAQAAARAALRDLGRRLPGGARKARGVRVADATTAAHLADAADRVAAALLATPHQPLPRP